MKTAIVFSALLIGLAGCAPQPRMEVNVHNPLDIDRMEEMVSIPLSELTAKHISLPCIVTDAAGKQLPYQVTYDSLLIFPASVQAKGMNTYAITSGEPDSMAITACGRVYPERVDDLAWENDKAAYRAYGPALQARGEKAYGYDVFTKSVAYPVVEERYKRELDAQAWAQINQWRAEGNHRQADSLVNVISYHVDHGNGMDCYSVGPTLGGGTTALMNGTDIIYPYCYDTCEILDNGPLRFTARLTFKPFAAGNDTAVVEQRIISLDKGSHLNRTEIVYRHLTQETSLATGIVVHPQNPSGYGFNKDERYIAYADSTDNPRNDNGVIYIGAVFEAPLSDACTQWFDEKRQKQIGALGHVLGISHYQPEDTYIYYWGSGWSKAGVASMEAWTEYLKQYALCVQHPLELEIVE